MNNSVFQVWFQLYDQFKSSENFNKLNRIAQLKQSNFVPAISNLKKAFVSKKQTKNKQKNTHNHGQRYGVK